ncbi:MAG: hypothetical protein A2W23_09720 [Planctomycetes bacterium RBG_16_43_13]|nr:MAG: hypothetical protein A2W23_09720 [Planctomycetes bacterium RBG_16_43_13]
MQNRFTAVIKKMGDWYIGFVEEIPGVNTQGKTLSEVRRNLKEALVLILQANRCISKSRIGGRVVAREPILIRI